MTKRKQNPQKEALVQAILNQHQPESVAEMQDALKDIFGPMFEAMLKGEFNQHWGYEKNDRQEKKGIIVGMGTPTRRLKPPMEKFRSRPPVTEIPALNQPHSKTYHQCLRN